MDARPIRAMKPPPPAHLRRIAEHWPAIEKTLPTHANRAAVRRELESIAAKALLPKKLVGQFETRARLANQLISALDEDNPALVESLIKQRDTDRPAARMHDIDNEWYDPRLPQKNFRYSVLVLWDAHCG